MKHILFGALALLLSTTIQPVNAQEAGSSGVYAGVYGGYAWADIDNSAGGDPEPSGFDYGIYGGYKVDSMLRDAGYGINGAIEVFWGGSTADDDADGVDVEKGREFGINFRPGINLSNSTLSPYGIIGYRNTVFDLQSGGLSVDESYNGFELGLGTDLMQWDTTNLRAEYSYVWYLEEDDIDPSQGNLRLGLGVDF